jgi:hypothetical protein
MVSHPTRLQAIGTSQVAGTNRSQTLDLRPTIVKRTEQDFISAILAELQQGGVSALTGVVTPTTGPLTFLQPVHRTFYLVVLEVVCNPYNLPVLQPRLAPRKIDSAGLVVRRLDPNQPDDHQGWCKQGTVLQGWLPFRHLPNQPDEADLDPDPARRPPSLTAGHPEVDRHLLPQILPQSESVSPLFVAPPEVCAAAGRTILYGVIPVTSTEHSEAPPVALTAEDDTISAQVDQAIADMLPYYLRSSSSNPQQRSEPNTKLVLTSDYSDLLQNRSNPNIKGDSLNEFISSLQQLRSHFQAFDNPALLAQLNQITVSPNTDQAQPLGEFLNKAARILLDGETNLQLTLPDKWIAPTADQFQAIVSLIRATLMQRLATLTAGQGRFDDPNAQYQVRAFVRVKRPDGCPPQLIWSEYSPTFAIAPWYADSGLPPVNVVLPDVLSPKALANLKPNVAFTVPPKLFDFLNSNDPSKLKDGQGNSGNDGGLAWICSFNIPIITLCAYIVLNIFLQLFNLIFWWIFFIKICIPIPKKWLPK